MKYDRETRDQNFYALDANLKQVKSLRRSTWPNS